MDIAISTFIALVIYNLAKHAWLSYQRRRPVNIERRRKAIEDKCPGVTVDELTYRKGGYDVALRVSSDHGAAVTKRWVSHEALDDFALGYGMGVQVAETWHVKWPDDE